MIPFEAFPKIPRLNREIVITEKLDGTNAVIHIGEDDVITAGSRSRYRSSSAAASGAKPTAAQSEEKKT